MSSQEMQGAGKESTTLGEISNIPRPSPIVESSGDLRYNEVYQISSHNAYTTDKPDLKWQLEHNIYSLELDIHTKKDKGPCVPLGGWPTEDAEANDWFVFHENCDDGHDVHSEIDSNYEKLSDALSALGSWHKKNPAKHPVVTLWIDLKLEKPIPFSSSGHEATSLDDCFRRNLGADAIFTPGDLMQMTLTCRNRHNVNHLRGAVRNCRWPKMSYLRGRFIIALTGNAKALTAYIKGTGDDRVAFIAPSPDLLKDKLLGPRSAFTNVGDINDLPTDWTEIPESWLQGIVARAYLIKSEEQWLAAKHACYSHIATDMIDPSKHSEIEHGQHPLPCNRMVSVPSVLNQTKTVALSIFQDEADDLVLNFQELPSLTPPFDVVVSTNPAADTEVESGSQVNAVVQREAVTVPNLIGQSEEQAAKRWQGVPLRAKWVDGEATSGPYGVVDSMDPPPNTAAIRDSTVTIAIRRVKILGVPPVVGQLEATAVATIQAAGLRASVNYVPSTTQPFGIVISTDPAAGAQVEFDSPVTLVVQIEDIAPVPNVIGDS